jgi:hypothetical protein
MRRLNAPTWSRVTATNYSIADSWDGPFLFSAAGRADPET